LAYATPEKRMGQECARPLPVRTGGPCSFCTGEAGIGCMAEVLVNISESLSERMRLAPTSPPGLYPWTVPDDLPTRTDLRSTGHEARMAKRPPISYSPGEGFPPGHLLPQVD